MWKTWQRSTSKTASLNKHIERRNNMAILERFGDIIKANINDLLDKCEDPAKMIDQYLRELT